MAKKVSSKKSGKKKKVVLLVSGGPDSATLAKLLEEERKAGTGVEISAIYLRTGHASDEKEIEAANYVISQVGGRLEIIDIKDAVSALGGDRVVIHSEAAIMPFGNAIVLSIAIAYAFKIRADSVTLGIHADDARESNEYDRKFFDKVETAAAHAHSYYPTIDTPLIEMTKVEVIKKGTELGVEYDKTWSCIRGNVKHCGQCGACRARRHAFNLAGVIDPTEYLTEPLALQTAIH